MTRSNQFIVDQTNELARIFASIEGYGVEEGHCFEDSNNLREIKYWGLARAAQILLTNTDPDDALAELEQLE